MYIRSRIITKRSKIKKYNQFVKRKEKKKNHVKSLITARKGNKSARQNKKPKTRGKNRKQ